MEKRMHFRFSLFGFRDPVRLGASAVKIRLAQTLSLPFCGEAW
jgi:hypothetical protein